MHVTQQQIADMAGVSRATVDRVLKNRGKVNPEVAQRIHKIIEDLGYRPNRAGVMLVRSKRPLKLGVVIQSIETPFMAGMLKIIEDSRSYFLEQGAQIIVKPNEGFNCENQLETIDSLQALGIDGLALTPVIDERIRRKINSLSSQGIPVVTFNTDIPVSDRLCYVGQDHRQSGITCASLMELLLGGRGTVLPITGHRTHLAHQQRINGFRTKLRQSSPDITILPLEYSHDDPNKNYEIVARVLRTDETLNGIYFSSNGQADACRAMRDLGVTRRIHIVCHDLIEVNAKSVKDGMVDFLIDQNARLQAMEPLEILINNILSGARPAEEYVLAHIDIRNRYNIDY